MTCRLVDVLCIPFLFRVFLSPFSGKHSRGSLTGNQLQGSVNRKNVFPLVSYYRLDSFSLNIFVKNILSTFCIYFPISLVKIDIICIWVRKLEPDSDSEMELIGSTLTANYARPKTSHFLPAISTMASSYRNPQQVMAFNPSANIWRTNSFYKSNSIMPSTPSIQHDGLDLVRARTSFFPSNRTAMTNRYTPDDWYKSNQSHYWESESSRKSAERLRKDTIRLIQDKDQLTRRTQENTSKNISERLNDIRFWKSELSHEIDNMVTEIAALTEVKRRLERALAETQGPLQV